MAPPVPANGSYLFPVGDGLEVTARLINSNIGYESFLAIQNINYTRSYLRHLRQTVCDYWVGVEL